MSNRTSVGGNHSSGSLAGRYAPATSTLATDSSFERGQLTKALFNILAVVFGIPFLCLLAGSLPFAIFMMFFASF